MVPNPTSMCMPTIYVVGMDAHCVMCDGVVCHVLTVRAMEGQEAGSYCVLCVSVCVSDV